jgi:archaellum component FlaC
MEKTIEQLQADRYNLKIEYNTIKSILLQKIDRMEEIEEEVKKLDQEINNFNIPK